MNHKGEDAPHAAYGEFLQQVVSSQRLWAVWCGDRWATSDDSSGGRSALFLLWSSKQRADAAFVANRGIFPPGAEVDAIELGKWLDLYTADLVGAQAAAFIVTDVDLKGLVVDPVDLQRDLRAIRLPHLQGADLVRLRAKVAREQAKGKGKGDA